METKSAQTAVDKGKAISEQVNRYADTLKAKNAKDFRTVPGFGDYEWSAAMQVLRSRKTGKVQQIPAGKKKYLIFNGKGERRSIGVEEIAKLLPAAPAAEKASSKAPRAAKADKGDRGPTKKEKIMQLHKEGKTLKEIVELTGFKYNSVYILLRGGETMEMYAKLRNKGETRAAAIKAIQEKLGHSKEYIEWRIGDK